MTGQNSNINEEDKMHAEENTSQTPTKTLSETPTKDGILQDTHGNGDAGPYCVFPTLLNGKLERVRTSMPLFYQELRAGKSALALTTDFGTPEAQSPSGGHIPVECYRAARVLRITDPNDGCQNDDGGNICCCNGWYKWRKGWANSRWARKALELFLAGEVGGQPVSKKIQVHSVVEEEAENNLLPQLLPQLTFLFLLLDGLVIENGKKAPTLEILRADGSPIPVPGVGLDSALQDFHMMFNHLEDHGDNKYGMIRVVFNINNGPFALLWMPKVEDPDYVYDDDGLEILDSLTIRGWDETGDGIDISIKDPASSVKGIEPNTTPQSDEHDTSKEEDIDADIVYKADSLPTNKPGHSTRILLEGRMDRPEGPWKQRVEVNRRPIGHEECPHCQKKSAEGNAVEEDTT